MKIPVAVTLVLAMILSVAGCAQTTGKPAAKNDQSELPKFQVMIAQHPHILALLKKDPKQVFNPEFDKSHWVVGQFLSEHPRVKDELQEVLKTNPKFFEGIVATRQGGGHQGGGHHSL